MPNFDALRAAIYASALSFTQTSRALSELLIVSERRQADKGNISQQEFERYQRAERADCDRRIEEQKRLGLG